MKDWMLGYNSFEMNMSEQDKKGGENVSEIQRLTTRAHDLSVSVGHWNNAYMVVVALTVLLAGAVFITQFIASRKSRLLSDTQEALIAEKIA
jgi:hypothetical protein